MPHGSRSGAGRAMPGVPEPQAVARQEPFAQSPNTLDQSADPAPDGIPRPIRSKR